MAKTKIITPVTGQAIGGQGMETITPHAAIACKNISFTALPTPIPTEEPPAFEDIPAYSIGLIFMENPTASSIFEIREVFFHPHPSTPTFTKGPELDIEQIPHQFFIDGDTSSENYFLKLNSFKKFEHLEFKDHIDPDHGLDFVFFTRNELEPLLALSETLIISGSVIKFGKVTWQHPASMVKSQQQYFTLKAEVNVKVPASYFSILQQTDSQDEIPLPLVTTAQPCPPRWDTLGIVLASLSISQDAYRHIISNPDLIKKILERWILFSKKDIS